MNKGQGEPTPITRIYKFHVYWNMCHLCGSDLDYSEDGDPYIFQTSDGLGYITCDNCGENLANILHIEPIDLGDITNYKFRGGVGR